MDYEAVLAQVLELLQREKRLSYRVLKRRLGLDDDELEDLKEDLIYAKRLAVDEEGHVLVWTGAATAELSTARPERAPDQAPLAYTPAHLTEKILASRAALEGERKQVTVLFADIKDSTELIRDLDPEAAQQLLDPAIQGMMAAVHRFEGTVNQVLGDGIMALFGAPIAHEDHALRACYAALAMQATLRDYTEEVRRTGGLELRIRVGLNAGEVVVRTIGNDLHMDYSAVGQTTHLAARMEQLATPGTVRLTAATLRLAEGLVQVNVLGPIPIKGLTEPVEVFELVGATAVRQRFQARAAQGLTRFVGRQRELDALHQALEQAGAGHGQVVALVGEAGVGKSRLVYEFAHSHHTQGWRVLESPSVSYGKATPYFPVIELLKRYCHLEDHDDHRTIRAKVTGQVLTLDEALQDTTPALLALLDALPADSPFLALDPPQRRQRTLDALKRVLLRESQALPLVLVFEDLHWIDAETQALLDSLVESLPTARLLLLVNYRPEYQPGWGSKTYYAQLRLAHLPPASADELLQALLGNFSLQVELNFRLGQVYHQIGEYSAAMNFLSRNVENAELLQGELAHKLGLPYSPSVFSRAYLVSCLAERGEFLEGLSCGEEAVRIAEALDQPFSVVAAYYGLGLLALRRGQLDQAMPFLERSLSVCRSAQTMIFFLFVASALGAAQTLRGLVADAVILLEEAREQAIAKKSLFGHTVSVVHLSGAYLRAGQIDAATEAARQAIRLARDYKERSNEAYVLRLLGDIAAHRQPPEVEPAETHYRQALALAEESDMRPLQAHCHHGLGTLYTQTGQREQARAALTAAIALYRAMDMTFWLPQAEAALAQVEE